MKTSLVPSTDPVLKQVCGGVSLPEGREIGRALVVALRRYHNGVGLAAPQIGVAKRVIVIRPNRYSPPIIMINPVLLWYSDKTNTTEEGCLSFPGVVVKVERSNDVKVLFTSGRGNEIINDYAGFSARIVQHELDHLNGICKVGDA